MRGECGRVHIEAGEAMAFERIPPAFAGSDDADLCEFIT